MTSFLSNLAIHWKAIIYYIPLHAETAEPLRVSPPEAVDYVVDLEEGQFAVMGPPINRKHSRLSAIGSPAFAAGLQPRAAT